MMQWQVQQLGGRALPAEWTRLNAADGHVLTSADFVSTLLEVFGHDNLYLAKASENGKTLALLLLERAGIGRWQSWQPSQAPITLGVGLSRLIDADWQSLCRALPGFKALLSVLHLDPQVVTRPAAASGFSQVDYIRTAWVELPGDFDAYWAARGKNLRQNINKCYNRLERDGVVPRLVRLRDAAQMVSAVTEYGRIESASWKADGGTAISPDNDQGRFYSALLERFAARNSAEVWQLWYGDRCIACDLCIEDGAQIIILKTTYDEAEARTSPAQLMRYEAFKALSGEGRITRIEFFGRMMEWHGRLTEYSRMLYHLNVYRWDWIRRLHERKRAQIEAAAEARARPVRPVPEKMTTRISEP